MGGSLRKARAMARRWRCAAAELHAALAHQRARSPRGQARMNSSACAWRAARVTASGVAPGLP